MHLEPENFYHVFNRSYNKTPVFYKPENYVYFLKKVTELTHFCDILAYCLMPSHFHLLTYLRQDARDRLDQGKNDDQGLTRVFARKIGTILSSYTQAINKQESKSGSLFQPKSKAKELKDSEQAFICFQYIHQNPLKAGLVSKIEDWKFSSFNEYYKGDDGICNRSLARELLDIPEDADSFYKQSYDVIDSYKGEG